MSSFDYVVSNAGFGNPSGQDKFRQFLNLYGADRISKSDTFVISGSLPEESYPSVTGLGFRPEMLILVTQHEFGGGGGQQVVSVGGAAHGEQFGCKLDYPSYLGGRNDGNRYGWHSNTQIIPELVEVNSLDDDGFTLNVANPIGYDLSAAYFAARGGGAYKAGTDVSPGAGGTQSITGLGFQPAAVIFFSAHVLNAPGMTADGARMSIGGSDDQGHNYSAWTGSGSGDIYNNSLDRQSAPLFAYDASGVLCFGSGTFCRPHVEAEGAVTMTADGFDIAWTYNEGPAFVFSWIAVQNAEVGRFIYNHTSADYFAGTHFSVPTSAIPKGLVFFMNDLGHDQTTQNSPSTEGATLAIGACGSDLSDQWLLTWLDTSRGIGFGAPLPHAALRSDHGSFGCDARAIAGFGIEDIDNGAVVTMVGAENFVVGMNYRSAARRGHRGRMLHSFQ